MNASKTPAGRIVVRPRHRGALLLALPALVALLAGLLLMSA